MPFTVSHIAAVLPAHRWLRRKGLLAAAMIGAMVPDFGLLLPLELEREQTHGRWALLSFCLPVGLFSWWIFQWLIRPALLELAPPSWVQRLRAEHAPVNLSRLSVWVGAGALILVGAVTHLAWDGFTHEGARGVRFFPMLEEAGPSIAGHSFLLYRWLQHTSSVLGLLVVMVAAGLWMRHAKELPAPREGRLQDSERWLWCSAYALIPVVASCVGLFQLFNEGWMVWWGHVVQVLVISGMYGLVAALLLVSLLLRLRLLLFSAREPFG